MHHLKGGRSSKAITVTTNPKVDCSEFAYTDAQLIVASKVLDNFLNSKQSLKLKTLIPPPGFFLTKKQIAKIATLPSLEAIHRKFADFRFFSSATITTAMSISLAW